MALFFGPEISSGTELQRIADLTAIVHASDYFLVEMPNVEPDDFALNTQRKIDRLREIRAFMDATGKPAFVAHPFRDPVNFRLVKGDIEPWVRQLPLLPPDRYSIGQINELFMMDVATIAQAAADLGVTLEVNGGTHGRIRNVNMHAVMAMLRAAYRVIRDAGVDLICGSDQHGLFNGTSRQGVAIPIETLEHAGVDVRDMRLIRDLLDQYSPATTPTQA
jgi:hypothetical protein